MWKHLPVVLKCGQVYSQSSVSSLHFRASEPERNRPVVLLLSDHRGEPVGESQTFSKTLRLAGVTEAQVCTSRPIVTAVIGISTDHWFNHTDKCLFWPVRDTGLWTSGKRIELRWSEVSGLNPTLVGCSVSSKDQFSGHFLSSMKGLRTDFVSSNDIKVDYDSYLVRCDWMASKYQRCEAHY